MDNPEWGHYVKCRFYGARWDLRNGNQLCHDCNQRDEREPDIYREFIIRKYGPEVEAELQGLKMVIVKPVDQHMILAQLQDEARKLGVKV
jgi:nitrite reductase/ring-hydroxylating ferredoxin subunit